ncbi:hypothetical protein [Vibrio phage BONAISHI]|nr:hypothetical protein [Vibrio phage BONAISHI]
MPINIVNRNAEIIIVQNFTLAASDIANRLLIKKPEYRDDVQRFFFVVDTKRLRFALMEITSERGAPWGDLIFASDDVTNTLEPGFIIESDESFLVVDIHEETDPLDSDNTTEYRYRCNAVLENDFIDVDDLMQNTDFSSNWKLEQIMKLKNPPLIAGDLENIWAELLNECHTTSTPESFVNKHHDGHFVDYVLSDEFKAMSEILPYLGNGRGYGARQIVEEMALAKLSGIEYDKGFDFVKYMKALPSSENLLAHPNSIPHTSFMRNHVSEKITESLDNAINGPIKDMIDAAIPDVSGFLKVNKMSFTGDLNTVKTAGTYTVGDAASSLPSWKRSGCDFMTMIVSPHASNNGVQILLDSDYDSLGDDDIPFLAWRAWEGSNWTDWVRAATSKEVAHFQASIDAVQSELSGLSDNLTKSQWMDLGTFDNDSSLGTTSIEIPNFPYGNIVVEQLTSGLKIKYKAMFDKNRHFITIIGDYDNFSSSNSGSNAGTWAASTEDTGVTEVSIGTDVNQHDVRSYRITHTMADLITGNVFKTNILEFQAIPVTGANHRLMIKVEL